MGYKEIVPERNGRFVDKDYPNQNSSLSGDLKEFSLEKVAKTLGVAGETGCLSIEGEKQTGRIYFRKGKIYFATSDINRKKIGEMLKEAGYVTGMQLQKALNIQNSGIGEVRRLGEILVDIKTKEGERIDDAVDQFVKDQVYNSLSEIIHIEKGSFRFIPGEIAVGEDICVYVDPEQLSFEMKQQLEEWREIREYIPSSDSMIELNASPPTLSPPLNSLLVDRDEWKVLVEIANSETKPNVSYIGEKLKLTTVARYRLILKMLKSGLISIGADGNGENLQEKQTFADMTNKHKISGNPRMFISC